MITNARVLQSEFIPGEVKHRDAEVSHLSDTLRPIVDVGHPTSSFLYGPTGAGKTCIARYTVDQMREEVVEVDTQYVEGVIELFTCYYQTSYYYGRLLA